MSLALAAILAQRPTEVRRFLQHALEQPAPSASALDAAGVPRWDAVAWLARLRESGELTPGGWTAEARAAYADHLRQPAPNALARTEAAERPREKALRTGIESLDDHELLALLLRTGGEDGVIEVARRLLDTHGGLPGLARLDVATLADQPQLGPAKAAELAAAFELARRLAQAGLRQRPVLTSPEAVVELLAPLAAGLAVEECWCLPLDPRGRLIGAPRVVGRGDVDGTDAAPRAFLRLALMAGATAAILVHNHPTGDPSPSNADLALTRAMAAGARAVGLALHDHIVLGDAGRYCSLRRERAELFR